MTPDDSAIYLALFCLSLPILVPTALNSAVLTAQEH